jgi:glucose-1-phosphate cytidylyltransferase
MKVVILAGGMGTRLGEETSFRPKPMVEIGGKPMLWHIMKIYAAQGFHEFIICLGFKGYIIKEFFANHLLHMSDVTFDMKSGTVTYHDRQVEPWQVTLVDTGQESMTGGRLKRIGHLLGDEAFCFTYGDGVSNVDLQALVRFHREQELLATVTAVRPPGRFGSMELGETQVTRFKEKALGDVGWINGGFFVLSPRVLDFIADDATIWEREPMEELTKRGQLAAFRHTGFWHCMDTMRDKLYLEELWRGGQPPWKIWD